MAAPEDPSRYSRRAFVGGVGATILLAACGKSHTTTSTSTTIAGAAGPVPGPTETTFTEPTSKLSGNLRILMWSHFVPRHDTWFDGFAKDWGQKVGVNVTVDHIDNTQIPARIAAEIGANQGHDVIQYIAPLAQFEPSVLDMSDLVAEAEKRFGTMLDLCRRSSFNPHTNRFYGYAPGWVPDPGDYRKSLWTEAGLPNGPTSWDDLLTAGAEIKQKKSNRVGIGLSSEIDSNMAGRALIWSFGGGEQDDGENVTLNSPETVAAVEFMAKLFKASMTDEVFGWNPASNNQGLIAGELSYILNSISAWRSAQKTNPVVADDIFFVKALKGPKTAVAAQHVLYNWIIPKFATNVDAANNFLLHYTANFDSACYNSELYDFPAFKNRVPHLDEWLANDPYGAKPADKLSLLKFDDAVTWSTNIGHPGPANTAIGEVFNTFVLPTMFAKAARGELSPQAAVTDADQQIKAIFDKWRKQGLVGGTK
jgi:ABC-type glycerol-3-phosphate transport system substrate-binding protein